MNLTVLLITLAGGIYCITRGVKDLTAKGGRVYALYMLMASCALLFALGILVRMLLSLSPPATRAILGIQGIDAGVWLGIFLAMRITGNFDRNKNETKVGRQDNPSQDDREPIH